MNIRISNPYTCLNHIHLQQCATSFVSNSSCLRAIQKPHSQKIKQFLPNRRSSDLVQELQVLDFENLRYVTVDQAFGFLGCVTLKKNKKLFCNGSASTKI